MTPEKERTKMSRRPIGVASAVPETLLRDVGGVPSPITTRAASLDERVLGWRHQNAGLKEGADALDDVRKKLVKWCAAGLDDLIDGVVLVAKQMLHEVARSELGRQSRLAADLRAADVQGGGFGVSSRDRQSIEDRINEDLLFGAAAKVLQWDAATTGANGTAAVDPDSLRGRATKIANTASARLQKARAKLVQQRAEFLRPRSLKDGVAVLDLLKANETRAFIDSKGIVGGIQWLETEIENALSLGDEGKDILAKLDPPARQFLNGVITTSPGQLVTKIGMREGKQQRDGELLKVLGTARRLLVALDDLVEASIPESIAQAGTLIDILVSLYRDIASKGSLSHYSPADFDKTFMRGGGLATMEQLQFEPDESWTAR